MAFKGFLHMKRLKIHSQNAQFKSLNMYNINENFKIITKSGFCRKKCLQKPYFYYIIVKRGMTYDDVGGYQLREVTDFAVNFHGECPNREFGRHGHLI